MSKVEATIKKKRKKNKAKAKKNKGQEFGKALTSSAPLAVAAPAAKRFTDEDRTVLAGLAAEIWLLGQRYGDDPSLCQRVERFTDKLRELDIEIIDRTGTTLFPGETVDVAHNEAPEGWTGPLVVTMVTLPTVRIGDHTIQGRVVVGPSSSDIEEKSCQEK